MSTVPNVDSRVTAVSVTDDTITATLADGRTISVPLVWSWAPCGRDAGAACKLAADREWCGRPLARRGRRHQRARHAGRRARASPEGMSKATGMVRRLHSFPQPV